MKKSNYAFIDSQNLNLAVQGLGWKLDFAKFRIYLKHKFRVTKAFIFIGYVAGNEAMYSSLQDFGYHLIFRPTLTNNKGKIKGNCDSELVLHSMIEYQNYDKAVIVSGDGDFHCLIEHLENNEKLEKIIIPNKNSFSSLLRKFDKKIVFLNKEKEKLEKRGHNLIRRT